MTRVFSPTALLATMAMSTFSLSALAQGNAMVGPGIARFHAPYFTPADKVPSYATMKEIPATGEVPAGFKLAPVFSKVDDKGVTKHRVRIELDKGTSLYGTGEVAGPLERSGRSVTLWNYDAFGYQPDYPSLYQSHPWVLAVRADGTAFGVLADTSWRCEIKLDGAIEISGEGAPYPVYIIDRASPQEVMKGLAELVGTMPLPPKWAIGYHQCRYSYNPDARVREVANEFRKRSIPCDVIWFDIDYMDGYRVFTFDKAQFPDVPKLNADLGKQGFSRIWMIDPGVKAEKGYFVYDQMIAKDLCVRTAKGEIFEGAVWPGMCVFPDYTRPEVREWWAGLYKDFMAQGISGVWNDMNEPAVFGTPTKTMPEDNVHKGGKESFGEVKPGPHTRFHNVYGMLMAKGTFDGIKAAVPEKRPFVLTRAGFIGSHRYAATWTGDNSATWYDMEQSIPMALNLGLSGQPFAGPDITGFNGNGPRDTKERAKLMARWYGIGSMLGFSRGHTAKGNIDKEPWAFGPEAEVTIRHALERRYRMLPYFYTLFREASLTGMPVVRPAFFVDPTDQALRGEDDVFLVGNDVLVVPELMPDNSRVVLEPKAKNGTWKQVEIVGEKGDADLPKLKVRPGAIVPLGPVVQYVGEKPLDPLTLIVNLDSNGQATGELYEDAGDGFAYQSGEYLHTKYAAKREGDKVMVTITSAEGKMARAKRNVVVQVLTGDLQAVSNEKSLGTDGQPIVIEVK
jgi:alpha-glucosidase